MQVTREGVTVLSGLPAAERAAHWQPPGADAGSGPAACVTHASALGAVVVVATSAQLHCLEVVEGSLGGGGAGAGGPVQLRLVCSRALAHQLSALHVCQLGGGGGGKHGPGPVPAGCSVAGVAVVLGYWLANRLAVVAADGLAAELATADLGRETARSAALLALPGGRTALGVGTNSGLLLAWEVEEARGTGAGAGGAGGCAWVLTGCASVRVSSVAVELSVMPDPSPLPPASAGPATHGGPPPCIMYAHSGSDAIVRPARGAAPQGSRHGGPHAGGVAGLLEVARVHGR